MFAEAALDTLVYFRLDFRHELEVRDVCERIGVDDDAGIEQVVRVGDGLQFPHDAIGFRAPFGFDKGSHVAAGAVFGFERAIVLLDDHCHNIVHKVAVAVDFRRGVEALGEDEVQVAVFGVAEDDGVV